MKNFYASAAMLSATIIWGLAFSAQANGVKHVRALLFVTLRSFVGAASLALIIILLDLLRRKKISVWGSAACFKEKKFLLTGGLLCGLIISAASTFQQLGLFYVSAGKTGFLTALYVIIVPLAGIFFKRRTPFILWLAVLLALLGAYLLCGGISKIGIGEIFVVVCSILFALHIMVIDRFAPHCDCLRLSCIQFLTAAVTAAFASLCFAEPWIWQDIIAALPFWIFCGVGSSGIAFTLQMVAQKYLHPVTAALIMSMESIFAVLGGWIFLDERLSVQEFIGCGVILSAVIFAQIPEMRKTKTPERL